MFHFGDTKNVFCSWIGYAGILCYWETNTWPLVLTTFYNPYPDLWSSQRSINNQSPRSVDPQCSMQQVPSDYDDYKWTTTASTPAKRSQKQAASLIVNLDSIRLPSRRTIYIIGYTMSWHRTCTDITLLLKISHVIEICYSYIQE